MKTLEGSCVRSLAVESYWLLDVEALRLLGMAPGAGILGFTGGRRSFGLNSEAAEGDLLQALRA